MRLLTPLLALTTPAVLATKPDGTCGYQCKTDADCGGCGPSGAGKCSSPDASDIFPEISASCVAAPADPPSDPKSDVADSTWPRKWTGNVDSWTYSDFTSKVTEAHGKFYYDADLGRSRADWHPYINGKDATQVWVTDFKKGTSRYYVKLGIVCISFGITDPGQGKGALVGVEKPDWMQKCTEGGWGKHVGREQVLVDGKEEWADHWTCRMNYKEVNQSITFQNWHSLGLGKVPKGLPLRVTGGNSAPNPTKGSPRLNSVWYSNFVTGDQATSEDDFKVPNHGLCVPVGETETESFFGHSVTKDHAVSADFHRRAHFLPHAKPGSKDLTRAKRRIPGSAFKGDDFMKTMRKLNSILVKEKGLKTHSCRNLTLDQIHDAQRTLFDARSPDLDIVYEKVDDTRRMAHRSLEDLKAEHQHHHQLKDSQLLSKARDGACHEAVMWYVHHLTEEARDEVKKHILLPLLPDVQHEEPKEDSAKKDLVHKRYKEQISCAVCHVTPTQPTEIVV
eukprot:TRINITY_DN112655_c0_g1_i1.p1 TRINITY_DN112655_c0_g1~~TRINITY_DN112655_c0_g1_i1.p1  ORF type:complete len:506 (+),score=108.26 TRINITY_DN112655_c0_g1_i1:67-1584(+)